MNNIIALRKSLWDNLSVDDRKAFMSAAVKSYALMGWVMEDSFARQIEALKADGADVRLMNDDEVSYWERVTDYRSVQEKWIKQQDIDGIAEVLEEIRMYLAK